MAHRNDVILSPKVRFGSTTSARRGVDQLFTASGYRHANQVWATPLRTLALSYRLEMAEIYDILETFHALGGPFDTFLARDWSDWHTALDRDMRDGGDAGTSHADAPLMNPGLTPVSNVGDGTTKTFHPYKRYAKGASASLDERIRHPVDDANFKIGINGSNQASGWTLNADGTVTFDVAPSGSPAATLTWGGSFHRAVHFLNDDIEELIEFKDAYSYTGILLQEARGV